jgi:hypothetical protein
MGPPGADSGEKESVAGGSGEYRSPNLKFSKERWWGKKFILDQFPALGDDTCHEVIDYGPYFRTGRKS